MRHVVSPLTIVVSFWVLTARSIVTAAARAGGILNLATSARADSLTEQTNGCVWFSWAQDIQTRAQAVP